MEQLSLLLNQKEFIKRKSPNCEKSYWIDLTAKMLNKPYKQIAGLTNHLDLKAIKDLYEIANEFKANPSALFWKLLKKTRVENGDNI